MYEFWGDKVFMGPVSTNSGWVQNPILLPTWYRNEGWGQSDFDSMSWKWASSHHPSMPQLGALRWGRGVLSPPLRPPWKWWEGPYVCSVVGMEIRPSHCQTLTLSGSQTGPYAFSSQQKYLGQWISFYRVVGVQEGKWGAQGRLFRQTRTQKAWEGISWSCVLQKVLDNWFHCPEPPPSSEASASAHQKMGPLLKILTLHLSGICHNMLIFLEQEVLLPSARKLSYTVAIDKSKMAAVGRVTVQA